MVSESTSRNTIVRLGKSLLIMITWIAVSASCTSPLEINVDRTIVNVDGSVHPKRLSFFYYFADSAYEAIVSDTTYLNEILIERSQTPWTVTVPQFVFELPNSIHPTPATTPLVRSFSLSCEKYIIDGIYRSCVGSNAWVDGEYLDQAYTPVPFRWDADNTINRILLAWIQPSEQNLIKGRVLISVTDPITKISRNYNGLITMEY